MATKIDALVAQLEQARRRLNAAIDRLPPDSEIYPSWQLKQLLDHITGWDELVCNILKAHQLGESLPLTARNINQFNARSVSARQSIPLEQSRQDFDHSRQEMIRILSELPQELLTTKFTAPWGGQWTVVRTIRLFAGHEREHAEAIESILAKTGAPPT